MTERALESYFTLFPAENSSSEALANGLVHGARKRYTVPEGSTVSAVLLSHDRTKLMMVDSGDGWELPSEGWNVTQSSAAYAARCAAGKYVRACIAHEVNLAVQDSQVPFDVQNVDRVPGDTQDRDNQKTLNLRYVFVAACRDGYQEDMFDKSDWVPLDDPRTESIATVIAKLGQLRIVDVAFWHR